MIELNDLNLQPAATHGSSSYLIFKPAVSLSTVLTKKMASQKIAKIALLILGCIAVLQAESTPKTADVRALHFRPVLPHGVRRGGGGGCQQRQAVNRSRHPRPSPADFECSNYYIVIS